jgi:hypothetical protein
VMADTGSLNFREELSVVAAKACFHGSAKLPHQVRN